ncbi:hypothetical protein MASR2M15_22180 [Anaerolineales bacterium]
MTDLVNRYVHQVGRYLPNKERSEIEAELYSMIQDQLADRYESEPTDTQIAQVLSELGDPYKMAISYGSEQYLVGPKLYPYMMMILRPGFLILPIIGAFISFFEMTTSLKELHLLEIILQPILSAIQVTFIFAAIVVFIFAAIQRANPEIKEIKTEFKPLDLPPVDHPGVVSRMEGISGIITGIIVFMASFYFLQVGGLTLNFNINNPGDVIPVPIPWLIALLFATAGMIITHILILYRQKWSILGWLVQAILETLGIFCIYFVFIQPLFHRISVQVPSFSSDNVAQTIAIIMAILVLGSNMHKLFKLWNYRNDPNIPLNKS